MLVNERVLFGTMNDNNIKTLATDIILKMDKICRKRKPSIVDYAQLRLLYSIASKSSFVEYSALKDKTPSKVEAKLTRAQGKEQEDMYNILTEFTSTLEDLYNLACISYDKATLHTERMIHVINYTTSFERTEKALADKLGQAEAMEFIASTKNGLLCNEDVIGFNQMLLDTQDRAVYGLSFLTIFYSWLDVATEILKIPELQLLKDLYLENRIDIVCTAKTVINNSITGNAEETTTKQNNLDKLFTNIGSFTLKDYQTTKEEEAALELTVRAFNRGEHALMSHTVHELAYKKQEILTNECYQTTNKKQ